MQSLLIATCFRCPARSHREYGRRFFSSSWKMLAELCSSAASVYLHVSDFLFAFVVYRLARDNFYPEGIARSDRVSMGPLVRLDYIVEGPPEARSHDVYVHRSEVRVVKVDRPTSDNCRRSEVPIITEEPKQFFVRPSYYGRLKPSSLSSFCRQFVSNSGKAS